MSMETDGVRPGGLDAYQLAEDYVADLAPDFGIRNTSYLGRLNHKQTMAVSFLFMFEPNGGDSDEQAARELRDNFFPRWKASMRELFSNTLTGREGIEALDELGFSDLAEMATLQIDNLRRRRELSLEDTGVENLSDHEINRWNRWERITALAASQDLG